MTEPLTPPDCDLRDFPTMPLDVRRLLTSETWVLGTAEEKVAAMTLWLESWHQVPAGSLPDNDRMLAHMSGAGARWAKVREHVMRSWVKADDGRFYHPVVCEKAALCWSKKQAMRERSRRGNEARWGASSDPIRTENTSHKDAETVPEGVLDVSLRCPKEKEKRKEEEKSKEVRTPQVRPPPENAVAAPVGAGVFGFDDFWAAYPRKVSRGAAQRAWAAAIKRADPAVILAGLARWQPPSDVKFTPHPAMWLNGERWADEEPDNSLDARMNRALGIGMGAPPRTIDAHPANVIPLRLV